MPRLLCLSLFIVFALGIPSLSQAARSTESVFREVLRGHLENEKDQEAELDAIFVEYDSVRQSIDSQDRDALKAQIEKIAREWPRAPKERRHRLVRQLLAIAYLDFQILRSRDFFFENKSHMLLGLAIFLYIFCGAQVLQTLEQHLVAVGTLVVWEGTNVVLSFPAWKKKSDLQRRAERSIRRVVKTFERDLTQYGIALKRKFSIAQIYCDLHLR